MSRSEPRLLRRPFHLGWNAEIRRTSGSRRRTISGACSIWTSSVVRSNSSARRRWDGRASSRVADRSRSARPGSASRARRRRCNDAAPRVARPLACRHSTSRMARSSGARRRSRAFTRRSACDGASGRSTMVPAISGGIYRPVGGGPRSLRLLMVRAYAPPRGDCQAWPKAPDSGSGPVGVRGFKSLSPHRTRGWPGQQPLGIRTRGRFNSPLRPMSRISARETTTLRRAW